jgi:hypothetical protein
MIKKVVVLPVGIDAGRVAVPMARDLVSVMRKEG